MKVLWVSVGPPMYVKSGPSGYSDLMVNFVSSSPILMGLVPMGQFGDCGYYPHQITWFAIILRVLSLKLCSYDPPCRHSDHYGQYAYFCGFPVSSSNIYHVLDPKRC